MSSLTDYAEKLLLDWLMTNGAVTRPTSLFIALFTAAPNDAAGSGTEVSGAGYARQAVTFAPAATPAGTTSNTNVVSFTASGGSFGTVSHIAIVDAATGGNRLWTGALGTPRTINSGDTLSFGVGSISLALA